MNKKDACKGVIFMGEKEVFSLETGYAKPVEQPEDPEQIVKDFLKQVKEPNSLLWALDELVVKDWRKWSQVRQEL